MERYGGSGPAHPSEHNDASILRVAKSTLTSRVVQMSSRVRRSCQDRMPLRRASTERKVRVSTGIGDEKAGP